MNNFTINKGIQNEFIITIKQDVSIMPMVINNADSFKVRLIRKDTDIVAYEIDNIDTADVNGYVSIADAVNGKIKIIMKSPMTSSLIKERGPKEDRYYLKPTYRIDIDCVTVNNGKFVAKINNVYID